MPAGQRCDRRCLLAVESADPRVAVPGPPPHRLRLAQARSHVEAAPKHQGLPAQVRRVPSTHSVLCCAPARHNGCHASSAASHRPWRAVPWWPCCNGTLCLPCCHGWPCCGLATRRGQAYPVWPPVQTAAQPLPPPLPAREAKKGGFGSWFGGLGKGGRDGVPQVSGVTLRTAVTCRQRTPGAACARQRRDPAPRPPPRTLASCTRRASLVGPTAAKAARWWRGLSAGAAAAHGRAAAHLLPGLPGRPRAARHACRGVSSSSSLHGIHDKASRCCSPLIKDRQSERVRQMSSQDLCRRWVSPRCVCVWDFASVWTPQRGRSPGEVGVTH